jgi:hypothetical protein
MGQTNRSKRRSAGAKRYETLTAFYRADPRRVQSRERDVGLWWREDVRGPLHRAAWVSETGELYLVRLGPPEQGGGRVEVLATVVEQERLESVLEGWRERCGEPRSLTWLRQRAAQLGGRARAAQGELAATFAGASAMLTTAASLACDVA